MQYFFTDESIEHLDSRGKSREKMLERELERLAGANWQVRITIRIRSFIDSYSPF